MRKFLESWGGAVAFAVAVTGGAWWIAASIGEVRAEVHTLETRMEQRIGGLESRMEQRIGGLESRIGAVEAKLDLVIEALDIRATGPVLPTTRKTLEAGP